MENIIEDIIKYGKLLHEKNLVIGSGGNISARSGNTLIIKKKGTDMSIDSTENYLVLDFNQIDDKRSVLSSETPFHLACYNAGYDINAVIHVHSPIIVAASLKTDQLNDICYEFDYIFSSPVPVIEYIQPGSEKLADAISKKIHTGSNAVILKKHGAVSVGTTLQEAYIRMLALERACYVILHT